MQQDEAELGIEQLAERVGVSPRTIRFYIARGLLAGPGSRGKGAVYSEDHLLRLRLIRRLVESHVPLEEVRVRLAGLALDDVRALLAEQVRQEVVLQQEEGGPSPKEYVGALLHRAREARQASPAGLSNVPAPSPPYIPAASATGLPTPETWQRWELAPGVELHVRSDVVGRQRALLEQLRAVAKGTE